MVTRRLKQLLLILNGSGVVALLLAGCQAVPITGRSQLNMVSDQEMVQIADDSHARFLTLLQKQNRILLPSESDRAAKLVASVQRVAGRIIDASGLRNQYAWSVTVVKAKEANAMVLPNGKIIVFSGILSVAKNDAGLAAVLGHEVAHVTARHSAERLSQELLVNVALTTADVMLEARTPRHQARVAAALQLGAQFGVLLPFSREHELEADRIGLLYMAKAGYDPSEAIGLWERMEKAGGGRP